MSTAAYDGTLNNDTYIQIYESKSSILVIDRHEIVQKH